MSDDQRASRAIRLQLVLVTDASELTVQEVIDIPETVRRGEFLAFCETVLEEAKNLGYDDIAPEERVDALPEPPVKNEDFRAAAKRLGIRGA